MALAGGSGNGALRPPFTAIWGVLPRGCSAGGHHPRPGARKGGGARKRSPPKGRGARRRGGRAPEMRPGSYKGSGDGVGERRSSSTAATALRPTTRSSLSCCAERQAWREMGSPAGRGRQPSAWWALGRRAAAGGRGRLNPSLCPCRCRAALLLLCLTSPAPAPSPSARLGQITAPTCSGLNCVLPKRYAQVPTPRPCERDFIWKKPLQM